MPKTFQEDELVISPDIIMHPGLTYNDLNQLNDIFYDLTFFKLFFLIGIPQFS